MKGREAGIQSPNHTKSKCALGAANDTIDWLMFLLIDLSFPIRPLRIGVLRLSIGSIARPGTINHRDSPAVTISQYKYSDGCHLTWEAFPECNNSVTRGVTATGKLMFGDCETCNESFSRNHKL